MHNITICQQKNNQIFQETFDVCSRLRMCGLYTSYDIRCHHSILICKIEVSRSETRGHNVHSFWGHDLNNSLFVYDHNDQIMQGFIYKGVI